MALYQFYNADLVEIPMSKHKGATMYIDSVILTATAESFQRAHKMLENIMTMEGPGKVAQ
jgi:hypothetical protein